MYFYSDIRHFEFFKKIPYLQAFLTDSFETRYVDVL